MRDDRKRQVETTKKRHGNDFYKKIAQKSATFRDSEVAKRAALKRWHPERFDDNGNLKQEEVKLANHN